MPASPGPGLDQGNGSCWHHSDCRCLECFSFRSYPVPALSAGSLSRLAQAIRFSRGRERYHTAVDGGGHKKDRPSSGTCLVQRFGTTSFRSDWQAKERAMAMRWRYSPERTDGLRLATSESRHTSFRIWSTMPGQSAQAGINDVNADMTIPRPYMRSRDGRSH